MRLHGLALLASTSLALANITACGARGSGGINIEVDGGGGGDVPAAPTDMGVVTPTDNGVVTPTDMGVVTPTDNGVVTPTDNGVVAPTDDGVVACAAPRTMCGAACVDTQSEQAHCGGCGRACTGGQICSSGSCQATSTCTAPRMVCDGACVNTRTDIENCGSCGRACPGGQFCNAGTCMATTSTCTAPRIACDGTCVDTRTDGANCGSCGRACAAGQFCSDSTCRSTSECAAPRMTCGASCIDITSDVFNCGECNRRCGDGQTCTAGRCVGGTPTCPSGTLLCGTRCIDVSEDPANCGACSRVCGSGTTCTTGTCMAIATGIAAGGTCTTAMCGPGGALLCTTLAAGGYCTQDCTPGSTPEERSQCGGDGSTCLTGSPFSSAGAGICTRTCNTAATSEATGGCRAGMVCTGFWFNQTSGLPDDPGCFPHCQTDAHCTGTVFSGTSTPRCNVRTGLCSNVPLNLALTVDGNACDPAAIEGSGVGTCRGTCFNVDSDPTHGVCGSYINLAVTPSCPDNPSFIQPLAAPDDNRALCLLKACANNSGCTTPLRCVYPERGGSIVTALGSRCGYPTALQPSGIP